MGHGPLGLVTIDETPELTRSVTIVATTGINPIDADQTEINFFFISFYFEYIGAIKIYLIKMYFSQ